MWHIHFSATKRLATWGCPVHPHSLHIARYICYICLCWVQCQDFFHLCPWPELYTGVSLFPCSFQGFKMTSRHPFQGSRLWPFFFYTGTWKGWIKESGITSPIHTAVKMRGSCANSPPLCEFLGGGEGWNQTWSSSLLARLPPQLAGLPPYQARLPPTTSWASITITITSVKLPNWAATTAAWAMSTTSVNWDASNKEKNWFAKSGN